MSTPNTAAPVLAHVRIPAFGCAVAAARDARLKHRPLVMVTGMHARGRVIEVSPAAGLMGVRPGVTLADVHRQFREVVAVPPDREGMAFAQKALERLAGSFSPLVESVNPGTLALDLSGTKRLWGEPLDAAGRISDLISQETGFDSCAGVAVRRVVSHVACRVARPMAPKWVTPETERGFLEPLPVFLLPGLGDLQTEKLVNLGIERIGQFMDLPEELALVALGQTGLNLIRQIRGMGITPVSLAGTPPLQVSEAVHPVPDTNMERASRGAVGVLTERSARRLHEIHKRAGYARLTLTYTDGEIIERSAALSPPIAQELVLLQIVTRLLEKSLTRRVRVRRLNLTLTRLYQGGVQRALFETPESVSEELSMSLGNAAQWIRTRFGLEALRLGAAWTGEAFIRAKDGDQA